MSEFQAIVIGGGLAGCAVAFELASRGVPVRLIEANGVAAGASGGIGERGIRANGRVEAELELAAQAQRTWSTLSDRLGRDTGFRRCGHTLVFTSEAEAASAEEMVARQQMAGIETVLLDAEGVRAVEPMVSQAVIGGVRTPDDGAVVHERATRSYADAAAEAGAVVETGVRCERLDIDRGRVCSIELTNGDRVQVDGEVLVASNAGAGELLAGSGLPNPFFTVWPQLVVVLPPPAARVGDRRSVGGVVAHLTKPVSVKALSDGRVMVTGGRIGYLDPVTGSGVVHEREVERNLDDASELFEFLSGAQVLEAAASVSESATARLVPIVDRVPGIENCTVAAGWTGHGFAIIPVIAQLLADWLSSGAKPSALEPLAWPDA